MDVFWVQDFVSHFLLLFIFVWLNGRTASFIQNVVNNGNNKAGGWKKDPVLALFLEILARLGEARKVLSENAPEEHSNIVSANAFPLFSQDHFEFMLCHVFYQVRVSQCLNESDIPIIWQTKPSERGYHTGSALLFQFEPDMHYAAVPGPVNADAVAENEIFRPTDPLDGKDNFWYSINTCFPKCPLSFVVLGRLYLELICDYLNRGDPIGKIGLAPLSEKVSSMAVNGRSFQDFWMSELAMRDWVKNTMKELLLKGCAGLDPSVIRSPRATKCWSAMLKGMNVTKLRRRIVETGEGDYSTPVGFDSLNYEAILDETEMESQVFDNELDSSTLGETVKERGDDIVLTKNLFVSLLQFRKEWMLCRTAIRSAQSGDEHSAQEAMVASNSFVDMCAVHHIQLQGMQKKINKSKRRSGG